MSKTENADEKALKDLQTAYAVLNTPAPQTLVAPNPCDIYNKIKFAIPAAVLLVGRIPIFGKYVASILNSLNDIALITCPPKV